jgi:hypothetical protein
MAELDKNKEELQKQVSSVFKGVPHPKNKNVQKSSDTPKSDQKSNCPPKPVSASTQIPKSSLISKLNQPEDSPGGTDQSQTANVLPKIISTKQTPQGSIINKLPQPKGLSKQPAITIQSEDGSFSETTGRDLWQQIKDKLFAPKPGVSPTRQKAMVIMIPILAIIMIFALRQVLSKAPSQTEGAGTDDAPLVSKTDTGNEIDWKIPEPITVITRDPIKLPNENDTQNPEQGEQNETISQFDTETIMVRDIVFSRDKPSAVIGSKIVYAGDVINDITIVRIDRDSVEFEKNGERWKQNVREGKKNFIIEVTDQSEGRSGPEE